MTQEPVWTAPFPIHPSMVNHTQKLGLIRLLDILGDAAWAHATQLGHGFQAMIDEGLLWVMTRQQVAIERWPNWGDTLEVRTWIRPTDSVFALRDYELRVDGERVGISTTSWVTIDLQTRAPRRVESKASALAVREELALDLNPAKLAPRDPLETRALVEVRLSDLDLNDHVNNTRYAQWVLDSLPREWHRGHVLKGYEVNFLAETRLGETIAIESETGPHPDGAIFQGRRLSDDKVVFTARLQVDQIAGLRDVSRG